MAGICFPFEDVRETRVVVREARDPATTRDPFRGIAGVVATFGVQQPVAFTQVFAAVFTAVGVGSVGFGGTEPLVGAWLIREVLISGPGLASSADTHALSLGLADSIPTTAGEMEAAEVLFPNGMIIAARTRGFLLTGDHQVLRLPMLQPMLPAGRRIVGAFTAGIGGGANLQLLMVVERVG